MNTFPPAVALLPGAGDPVAPEEILSASDVFLSEDCLDSSLSPLLAGPASLLRCFGLQEFDVTNQLVPILAIEI